MIFILCVWLLSLFFFLDDWLAQSFDNKLEECFPLGLSPGSITRERVVFVLISFLATTNRAAVQILEAGLCCIPTPNKRHHRMSAMAAHTAMAHGRVGCARHGAKGKQEAAWLLKLLIFSGGTKTTKTKLCPFTWFSWQSLWRFCGFALHIIKSSLIKVNLKTENKFSG